MSRLWSDLVDLDLLWNAWKEVRRRNSVAGVDGQSVTEFSWSASSNLTKLRYQLLHKRYYPEPLKGLYIPKPLGGWRMVGVPTVRDRIAQRACLNLLLPIIESHLEECSYAYRPGRSISDALLQIERWRDQGHEFLLESDIASCFDSIDRELLMHQLRRYVTDERLLELIQQWLSVGTLWSSQESSDLNMAVVSPSGIPQGSALSPLLCNLFLDVFDESILKQGFKLVRYADDFVIVATRRERIEKALNATRSALSEIGLRIHPHKTRLTTFDKGFRYLGTIFVGDMALPAIRQEMLHPNGESSVTFTAGYSSSVHSSQTSEPVPPSPSLGGITAASSSITRWNSNFSSDSKSAMEEAFQHALQNRQCSKRHQIQRESSLAIETTFLV